MSHRYRLYPDPGQEVLLERHCRDARFVWNLALEQCQLARRVGTLVDQRVWDRQLAEARQAERWLAEGSSSVQQAALRDLRQAFRNWWTNPGHFRAPSWRKAGLNEGFVVRDLSVAKLNRRWAEVTVPKAGRVRFRLTRPIRLERGPPGSSETGPDDGMCRSWLFPTGLGGREPGRLSVSIEASLCRSSARTAGPGTHQVSLRVSSGGSGCCNGAWPGGKDAPYAGPRPNRDYWTGPWPTASYSTHWLTKRPDRRTVYSTH